MFVLKNKKGLDHAQVAIKHCDGLVIKENLHVGTILNPELLKRTTLLDDAYVEEELLIRLTRKELEVIIRWHDKGYCDYEIDRPIYDKLKKELQ